MSADEVKEAPNIELHGDELSQADESRLYHHYEMNYTAPTTVKADAVSPAAERR